MQVLQDKAYRTYTAISRYSPFPYYYNINDEKYVYGVTKHLGQKVSYVLHEVKYQDTLDSLSLYYYGRPDYYWVIADFNRIKDPFIKLYGNYKTIDIPSINNVAFEDGR